jgi:hypothetical protein
MRLSGALKWVSSFKILVNDSDEVKFNTPKSCCVRSINQVWDFIFVDSGQWSVDSAQWTVVSAMDISTPTVPVS